MPNALRHFVLTAGIFCLGCAVFFAAAARAQDIKAETKDKLDVVLVMDASGSMLQTDPQRLRDEGAKLLMEFLKAGDRLAVVSFSRDAKTVKPLEDFEPTGIEDYRKAIAGIEANGIYTDLLAGVREAKTILDGNHREGANQAIVLLSDGKMDPDPAVASPTVRTSELLDQFADVLRDAGIKVYTLCFSDQADKQLLARLASSTEGLSWYTPDADKVHESYADLFLAVKKPQMLALSAKGFQIDSNISEATFYINRESENDEVKLRAPDGREEGPQTKDPNIRWFHGQKFDVVTLTQPEVGSWQIAGLPKNDGFATVLTNLKLVTDWPTTITAESPTLLQARLYESEKPVSLPAMSDVTRFALRITPADKVSEPIIKEEMNDEGKDGDKVAGDGIFSYTVKLDTAGEYKLKVLARSPTFERSQQLSFRAKPPLVELSLSEEEEEESLASAVGPEHEHVEEGATVEVAPKAPRTTHFVVELSEDAMQLKRMQLKLEALDEKKTVYRLPLVQSRELSSRYQASVATLPHEGTYQVRASISGEGKNKKDVRFSSQIIEFKKTTADGSAAVHVVLERDVKPPTKAGPWVWVGIVTLFNLLCAGAAISMLRNTKSDTGEALPDLEPPAAVLQLLKELEARVSLTQIELDDPLLGNLDNVAPAAPSAKPPDGPPAAQDLPPSPAVEEGVAAEAAPDAAAPAGEAAPAGKGG